jgi:hypothetical protein
MRKPLFIFLGCLLGITLLMYNRGNGSIISCIEFYFSNSQTQYVDELVIKRPNEILQNWRSLPKSTYHRQASILILVAQQLLEQGKLHECRFLLSAVDSLTPRHERLSEMSRRLLQSPFSLSSTPEQYDNYLSFAVNSSQGAVTGIVHDAIDYYLNSRRSKVSISKLEQINHFIIKHDSLCATFLSNITNPAPVKISRLEDKIAKNSQTPFMAGCALGLFSKDNSFNYNAIVDEIAQLHSTWISLVFIWEMASYQSTIIDAHGNDSVKWETLIAVTRYAKSQGLKVLWFPVVNLNTLDCNHWRGNLLPRDDYEWFRNYLSLLNLTATLAENETVEAVSIGAEFNSLQSNATLWNQCLASVRLRFHGLLTYSANWDSYRNVSFASAIDMLGVTGYFQLSSHLLPSDEELLASWSQYRDDLIQWSRESKIPIYFSEAGYPSLSSAAMQPWNYFAVSGINLAEQRRCYEAFYRTWHKTDALRGVFFYEFYHPGGKRDASYSPRGKPAERIIERWFLGERTRENHGEREPFHIN